MFISSKEELVPVQFSMMRKSHHSEHSVAFVLWWVWLLPGNAVVQYCKIFMVLVVRLVPEPIRSATS